MLNYPSLGRILVVGDLMADESHFYEAGAAGVLLEGRVEVTPGGAGNLAMALCALGVTVRLVAAWGLDYAQRQLAARFSAEGPAGRLETWALAHAGRRTARKVRHYAGGRCVLRAAGEAGPDVARKVPVPCPSHLEKLFDGVAALVFVDHGKGLVSQDVAAAFCKGAGARGVPVYADVTSWRLLQHYASSPLTVLKTGDERLAGPAGSAAGAAYCAAFPGAEHLVITGDREVVWSRQPHDGVVSLERRAVDRVEPVDALGAGDQFMAVMVAHHLFSGDLGEALEVAGVAARASVRRSGTSQMTLLEVQKRWARRDHRAKRGLRGRDDAAMTLLAGQSAGETSFVNGCFDVLHPGHLALFERARALTPTGLVVAAVNDDATVRELKGPGRPALPLAARAELLCAMPWLDLVVPFSSEDELDHLVKTFRPRFLVKGSEYEGKSVTGSAHAGRVVYVSGPDYRSSSVLEGARAAAP